MPTTVTRAAFIAAWERLGNAKAVADELGLEFRGVQQRRARLVKAGVTLRTTSGAPGYETRVPIDYRASGFAYPMVKEIALENGAVIISSDHHYWPDLVPLAHRALLKVIGIVKPRGKILNGDVFDGGSISRHPPLGWSERPTAVQELQACQERVGEIEQALPRGCFREWVVGNHDERFDKTLAAQIPQFAGLQGTRLQDHFHGWVMQRSLWINRISETPVLCLHNYANGIHAGYNNAMKAGVTIVTGHTHALECKPYNDMRGRRYGIQTGTVADLDGPQFEYQGNRPSQACSGFVVLTFRDGHLLPPELCQVINGKAHFRGEVVAQ